MQPYDLPPGLPEPDSLSLEHSRLVADHLCGRIRHAGGAVSFGEFMQEALYARGLGYYVAGRQKFGRDGDFITAPEISPLFGRVVATQLARVAAADSGWTLLELGAGSGRLAAQMLQKLRELDALPSRYLILEVSPELAARQRALLGAELPELIDRIAWISELPDPFSGAIVANEVADALPVERFKISSGNVLQWYVTAADSGRFEAEWRPAVNTVAAQVRSLGLKDGLESEVSPGLKPWIRDLLDVLQNGLLLVFDYGASRRDYYAAERSGGWLRCHFRHHAHDNPLVLTGIQDITSWVDFTAIAEAAVEKGELAGFVTQAMFLLQGGLDREFAAASPATDRERAELAQQVKSLTLPGEMGENFKCIGITRGNAPVPEAFSPINRVDAL